MQPTRMVKRRDTPSDICQTPFLFGFAPGGACPTIFIAEDVVRFYRTFSPLPSCKLLLSEQQEGSEGWRFVFCGAFPGVTPAGYYPAPCLCGARTFLSYGRFFPIRATARLSDHRKFFSPEKRQRSRRVLGESG